MTIRELIEDGTISLDTFVNGDLPIGGDGSVIGVGGQVFNAGINSDNSRYVSTKAPVRWAFPFLRPEFCYRSQDDAIRAAIARGVDVGGESSEGSKT